MLKRLLHPSYHRGAGFNRRMRMLTPTGWAILTAMLAAGIIGVDTNQAMSYQTFALLFATMAVAGFWYCLPPPRLDFSRDLPQFGTVGKTFTYRVHLRNPRPEPLRHLSVLEDFGDSRPTLTEFLSARAPGEERDHAYDRATGHRRWRWLLERKCPADSSELQVDLVPAATTRAFTMELTPRRRGLLRFEAAEIAARDPLGLSRRFRRVSSAQSLVVFPKRYPVAEPRFEGRADLPPGGESKASSIGGAEEFVSIRDYRYGDPLRWVHWKSSARTSTLLVKQFQDDHVVRQGLILDTAVEHHDSELFEEAVSVAASFAASAADRGVLTQLIQAESALGPEREPPPPEAVMRALALARPSLATFEVIEERLRQALPQLSAAICVFMAWDEKRQQLVRHFAQAGIPALVCVLVPPESEVQLDPGPMRGHPERLVRLELGKIAEGLASLR